MKNWKVNYESKESRAFWAFSHGESEIFHWNFSHLISLSISGKILTTLIFWKNPAFFFDFYILWLNLCILHWQNFDFDETFWCFCRTFSGAFKLIFFEFFNDAVVTRALQWDQRTKIIDVVDNFKLWFRLKGFIKMYIETSRRILKVANLNVIAVRSIYESF